MSKGNSSCHVPNAKYREGYERIFGNKNKDKAEKTPVVNNREEAIKKLCECDEDD